MGDVIYSANPFQAHLGAITVILVFLVMGFAGIGMAIFRRKQRGATRILIGALGTLFLLGGCIFTATTLFSFSGGVQTISTRFDKKSIAYDSCGDSGDETCARYVLTATSNGSVTDFDVAEAAYRVVQVNTCYQISYYPKGGLFGSSGGSDSYQQIDSVAKIQVADPSTCQ